MTDNPGIDYGMGQSNIDKQTGIRYGVISLNALNEWAQDSFEADYGEPHCPKCGNEVKSSDEVEEDFSEADYCCEVCRESWWSDAVFGDEPVGWNLDDGKYQATLDSDNDIFLVKSPYYTFAQFCSPCAPGAGHLEHPCKNGIKTYCFNSDWFSKENPCPYPIYRVDNNELCYTPEGGNDCEG